MDVNRFRFVLFWFVLGVGKRGFGRNEFNYLAFNNLISQGIRQASLFNSRSYPSHRIVTLQCHQRDFTFKIFGDCVNFIFFGNAFQDKVFLKCFPS